MTDNTDSPVTPRPVRVSFALPLNRPLATWVLLAIIAVMFVIRLGANVPCRIASGEYWRLLASMFLHIGLLHLLFNVYALAALGTELERLFGWRRFLAVYLVTGLFGSFASYAFRFGLSGSLASDTFRVRLSAGASGAIFGLIGALGAFFYLHRQRLGSWGQRRLANVLFLIGINLLFGFTQPGIDNLAHLGGLLSGVGLGWALAPRYQVDAEQLRLVDRNRMTRYWPALALAGVVLVGGVYLATMRHRESAPYHQSRGLDAAEREAWADAASELGQVAEGYSDQATAETYFYLGLARQNLGQPQGASEAYESALELEPDNASIRWNLVLAYYELGNRAKR